MDQYDGILNNIKRVTSLTRKDEKEFISILRASFVRKRQFLVQPGFVCAYQTYVVKGALRAYFVDDQGEEHTLQFAVEDWFISDFNSYINQVPASLFVEALEDSTIQQIGYEDMERLCGNNAKFERFSRKVAQRSFAFSQRRILSNLGKSAEERYLEFMKMYPNIAQRVPQYTIASYLGMTPEFLSKIRRKLAKHR